MSKAPSQVKDRTLREGGPRPALSAFDATAIIVGLVIGAGIFRLPSLVAANAANEWVFYGVWIAGGVISLIGALCYAELATAYPNAGGDYYFLQRAFGRGLSFLFAWARIAVITTGSPQCGQAMNVGSAMGWRIQNAECGIQNTRWRMSAWTLEAG